MHDGFPLMTMIQFLRRLELIFIRDLVCKELLPKGKNLVLNRPKLLWVPVAIRNGIDSSKKWAIGIDSESQSFATASTEIVEFLWK
jgi:hypothetical protein